MTTLVQAAARRGLCAIGCCLLFLSCSTTPVEIGQRELLQQAIKICASGETVDGIDISKWQGAIDWDKVAADGVVFAFIRATDGFYQDPRFAENWSEAKRVGIIRGVYQFFRPAKDPVAQAKLLLEMMGPLGDGDLPPVLDVEATDDQSPEVVAEKIGQWIAVIEAETGRKPIIYSGKYFWNGNVKTTAYNQYPLWIPQYGPVCPDLPEAWDRWVFFQFSSTGKVAGISGNVDMNVYNGSLSELKQFIGQSKIGCGDGLCSNSETNASCPQDCPVCLPIPPEGRVVDDAELCFEKGGDPKYWRESEEGYSGKLLWTKTTDKSTASNFAVWHLAFDLAGDYRVEAFVKAPWGQSQQARYAISANGQSLEVVINQSLADGWIELGAFTFASGADQWVRLDDNTGEPNSTDRQLVADAIRVMPLNPPQPQDPQPQDPQPQDPQPQDPQPQDPADPLGSDNTSPLTSPDKPLPTDPTTPPGDDTGITKSAGCQVGSRGAPRPAILCGLLLLSLVWFRRRQARI